jgi:hypothetical protein
VAAPVEAGAPEAELEDEDEELLSVRLPPVPALEVGETLVEASAEAFLYASRVLGPEALKGVSVSCFRTDGTFGLTEG